jgi:hypothetical protein
VKEVSAHRGGGALGGRLGVGGLGLATFSFGHCDFGGKEWGK